MGKLFTLPVFTEPCEKQTQKGCAITISFLQSKKKPGANQSRLLPGERQLSRDAVKEEREV